MTTLVTGATGFVGSAVVRALLARGEAVRVLKRRDSDMRNVTDLDVEIAVGDLTDQQSLHDAVKGCHGIYHLAADYRLWARNPGEIYATNVDGTRNLLLAAADAGVGRIVYTSSVATLGTNRDGAPADEQTPVALADMTGHYKRSKFLAEEEVRRLALEESLPVVIVNPSTPVGPRDVKPTPTGRMLAEAVAGRIPAYVDTGLNVVHVDDVAAGHLLAFERGQIGDRYILGGENMSLQSILGEVAALVGRPAPKFRLPHALVMPIAHAVEATARISGRRSEPFITVDSVKMAKKIMFFSSEKAERSLGYAARPAKDALADAVAWFRRNHRSH